MRVLRSARSVPRRTNGRPPVAAPRPGIALPPRVIFEGDSLTFGWNGQTAPSAFFAAAHPSITVYNVSNVGDNVVLNMVDQAPTEVDPKFVPGAVAVLWGGTNDLTGFTPAQTYSGISSWCAGRRAVGFKVVVCNLTKNPGISDSDRLSVNSMIAAGGSGLADARVDLASLIDDWTTHPTWWDSDHVHLLTAGYQQVANIVGPAILAA
jgi:lysophospholipase L1-like esterase